MKTTQVVSGFILGSSLLAQITSAQVVFDDGGVHVLNDDSLRNEYIQVLGNTTLRLDPGAQVGGEFNELGMIEVSGTATLILAGGQLGVGGGSSGSVLLYDDSRFIMEGGTLGGNGASSGQVIAFNRAGMAVLGGQLGGGGEQSGLIGFFDEATGEIRGGGFGGDGSNSGLVLGFATAQVQVFACESTQPFGPVAGTEGIISAVASNGAPLEVPFMREATATFTLVQECDDDPEVDTDGDGVPDSVDQCVESDLRPTLWIFNINTCIPNLINGQPVDENGCSLADIVNAMIEEASANARNRVEFVRAVASGLRDLREEGLLPNRWLGHFQNCAARCNWDDAKKRRHQHRFGDRDRRGGRDSRRR